MKHARLEKAISWLANRNERLGKNPKRLRFAWSDWQPWFDDAPCKVPDDLRYYLTRCLFESPLDTYWELWSAKEFDEEYARKKCGLYNAIWEGFLPIGSTEYDFTYVLKNGRMERFYKDSYVLDDGPTSAEESWRSLAGFFVELVKTTKEYDALPDPEPSKYVPPANTNTPLMQAIIDRDYEGALKQIRKKPKPNTKNHRDQTALGIACGDRVFLKDARSVKVIRALLKLGESTDLLSDRQMPKNTLMNSLRGEDMNEQKCENIISCAELCLKAGAEPESMFQIFRFVMHDCPAPLMSKAFKMFLRYVDVNAYISDDKTNRVLDSLYTWRDHKHHRAALNKAQRAEILHLIDYMKSRRATAYSDEFEWE